MQRPVASPSVQHFKARVTRLEIYLKSQNILITHSAALEALSVSDGFADWNTASAALKQSAPAMIGSADGMQSDLPVTDYVPATIKTLLDWPRDPQKNRDIPRDTPVFLVGHKHKASKKLWRSAADNELRMTKADLLASTLVLGSAGSGKSRFLLGALHQAMQMGAGGIYVDSKADNRTFWEVIAMAKSLNRLDDVLVLNLLSPAAQGNPSKSNNFNPFATGNSEQLRSLVVDLMRGGDDGVKWKGRASALAAALFRALVYLRDHAGITLDIDLIRSYLPLARIEELAQRKDIPDSELRMLRKYLEGLPQSTAAPLSATQVSAVRDEQHAYICMQLTDVMTLLGDTYRDAFGAGPYSIDFRDVIAQRKILVVILPSLEKDPDAASRLGKLVVASIRNAMTPALECLLNGSKDEGIIDRGYPFMLIFEEYGRYAVEGFAVVAAQARSLNIATIFADQDYPSFKRADEREAASTVANTSNKIIMKLDDADETFRLVDAPSEQRAARTEEHKRINLKDLTCQGPGEAHVLLGADVLQVKLTGWFPEHGIYDGVSFKLRHKRDVL